MSDTAPTIDSAAGRAYRALEHLVVTLELAPGETTTEGRLIELAGVGRTPTREAIQRLAWEGLLDIRPRAGITIAPMVPAAWPQILEIRGGVEIVLAREAARHLDGNTPALLAEAATGMERAAAAGDVDAYIAADKSTDEAIAAAAENPFAVRLAAPLQTHSRRFWYRYRRLDGLAASADHHLAVARAILAGDPARAASEAGALIAMLMTQARAASAGEV